MTKCRCLHTAYKRALYRVKLLHSKQLKGPLRFTQFRQIDVVHVHRHLPIFLFYLTDTVTYPDITDIVAVIGAVVLGLCMVLLFGFGMRLNFLHILGLPGLSKRQFRQQGIMGLQV